MYKRVANSSYHVNGGILILLITREEIKALKIVFICQFPDTRSYSTSSVPVHAV